MYSNYLQYIQSTLTANNDVMSTFGLKQAKHVVIFTFGAKKAIPERLQKPQVHFLKAKNGVITTFGLKTKTRKNLQKTGQNWQRICKKNGKIGNIWKNLKKLDKIANKFTKICKN